MDKLKLNADQMLKDYMKIGRAFATVNDPPDDWLSKQLPPRPAIHYLALELFARRWKYFRIVGWKTSLWASAIQGVDVFRDHRLNHEELEGFFPTVILFDDPIEMVPNISKTGRMIGFAYMYNKGIIEKDTGLIIVGISFDPVIAPREEDNLEGYYQVSVHLFKPDEFLEGPGLFVYAAEQFSRLEISTSQAIRPHRPNYRRMQRELGYVPEISVILLRRHKREFERGKEPSSIEWDCQWIVSGHWRKQWYPTEGIHKPVYIQPYVKGPEDKPLKPHAGSLYVVNR